MTVVSRPFAMGKGKNWQRNGVEGAGELVMEGD